MTNKLYHFTISQAIIGLQQKKFSATALVKSCLDRISKIDPKIKAFITISGQTALKAADKADQQIKQNKNIFQQKPLLGIPYSAKDVFCTKNIKTTAGSQSLANYIPPYNATVIQRLTEAGAILIGKTNCDPFGFGGSTENSGFFTTKNPWDLTKVPGGSSGGSAAAVACGLGLFSIAEDTGGSIRQPCSFCSVSGLKVTYGRVSRYGSIAYASSLDSVGPMAKTVADLAIIMEVIAGHDQFDATTLAQKVPSYCQQIKKKVNKIVIGLPKEYFTSALQPEVKNAILKAKKQFEQNKLKFASISLPHTKFAIPCYYLTGLSEASSNLARYDSLRYGESRQDFEQEVKRRIMLGTYALSSGYYDAYYQKAAKIRNLIKQDFDKAWDKVDAIIAPVSPFPPFKIGEKTNDPLQMWLADLFTVMINPAGVPALAIPVGFTRNNLPIGAQLIGPQFSEDKLLQIGHLYQQITDWHTYRPKI